jgi:hypothetical protein
MEGVITGVFEVVLNKKMKVGERTDLLSEIEAVRQRLETVASHFENQTDPDLIEASIYETKSLAARYRYLFREARRLGLTSGTSSILTRSERQ